MKRKIDLSKEYGLVLEGGGARGAYQIGAFKALKEEGVRIRGISGTSVGALNGAMIVMDDLEKAEEIWSTMTYSKVVDVDENQIEIFKKRKFLQLDLSGLVDDVQRVVKDKGVDITPLRNLISDTIDEDAIRDSSMELYATTFSVTDRKEFTIDVKSAAPGTMPDVLLASAYFPGFKNEKMGGKTFMDGGSVNNVPIDVLTDRGYKDVIVIRIYGFGINRSRLMEIPEDVRLYEVSPTRYLGGIMEFDEDRAVFNMKLGYYDAKKMMYGLLGRKYYLDLPESEAECFSHLMDEMEMMKQYVEPVLSDKDMEKLTGYRAFTEKIFPALARKFRLSQDWDYRELYAAMLERCAEKMYLDPLQIYTEKEITDQIHMAIGGGNEIR